MLDFILVTLILMLCGLAAWGVYYFVETAWCPETTERGIVCSLVFTPAYIMMVYNAALKMPLPQYIPDGWEINVRVENKALDGVSCSEECFNEFKIGDAVNASIKHGRLSGKKYLFGVRAT